MGLSELGARVGRLFAQDTARKSAASASEQAAGTLIDGMTESQVHKMAYDALEWKNPEAIKKYYGALMERADSPEKINGLIDELALKNQQYNLDAAFKDAPFVIGSPKVQSAAGGLINEGLSKELGMATTADQAMAVSSQASHFADFFDVGKAPIGGPSVLDSMNRPFMANIPAHPFLVKDLGQLSDNAMNKAVDLAGTKAAADKLGTTFGRLGRQDLQQRVLQKANTLQA